MLQKSSSVVKAVKLNFPVINSHHYFPQKEISFLTQLKKYPSPFLFADYSECKGLKKWSKLNNTLFNHLLDRMSQPTAGLLTVWFFTLMEALYEISPTDEEKFITTLQLFSAFADLCCQYRVQNFLSTPKNLATLFKNQDTAYLEICITALAGSKNKRAQAQLLDQLPDDVALMKEAFTHQLPFVCSQMIADDALQLHTNTKLANIVDYKSYKSSILVYIARNPWDLTPFAKLSEAPKVGPVHEIINSRLDFFACLKFITLLEDVSPKQIPLIKKRVLINRFIDSIRQFSKLNTVAKFMEMANKLKEIGEMDYCEKLFGNPTAYLPEEELNNYLQISHYLMLGRKISCAC